MHLLQKRIADRHSEQLIQAKAKEANVAAAAGTAVDKSNTGDVDRRSDRRSKEPLSFAVVETHAFEIAKGLGIQLAPPRG